MQEHEKNICYLKIITNGHTEKLEKKNPDK